MGFLSCAESASQIEAHPLGEPVGSWAIVDSTPEWVAVMPIEDCHDVELPAVEADPSVVRRWIETKRHHPKCWLCERGGCFQRVELLRNGCEWVIHGTILN